MIDDSKAFWSKDIECPVCKLTFRMTSVRKAAYEITERHSDFACSYKGVNPDWYAVVVCPHCGYASLKKDFDKLDLVKEKRLANALLNAAGEIDFKKFTQSRTADIAVESYKLAIKCYEIKELGPATIAGLHLRIAWIRRDQGDAEGEAEELKEALTNYELAFEQQIENLPEALGEVGIIYLIGELSRRTGDFRKAISWLQMATRHEDMEKRKDLENMARNQWQLARDQYAGRE